MFVNMILSGPYVTGCSEVPLLYSEANVRRKMQLHRPSRNLGIVLQVRMGSVEAPEAEKVQAKMTEEYSINSGEIPEECLHSYLLPLPKPGTDNTELAS